MLYETEMDFFENAEKYIEFIMDLAKDINFPLTARVALCEKFLASGFPSQLKIKLIEVAAGDRNFPIQSIARMLEILADEEDILNESFEMYCSIREQRSS